MVAGDIDIVADGVLGSDHRVDLVIEEQFCRVCLDGIARVHDQRGLGAASRIAVACWATLPEASSLLAA